MTGVGGLVRRRPSGYVARKSQRSVKIRVDMHRKHRHGWATY